MTPERWADIERLYHAARAQHVDARAAFLAEACGGDVDLRREVESLLAQESRAAGLLSTPPVLVAAAIAADGSSFIGRQLGPYAITARLGAGGMGEVYRARDTKLGRDVAIKILPRLFTSDPERLARFEREARVLAALNHPHIGAIYGLEEVDGIPALVLELVEGETLADLLARSENGARREPRGGRPTEPPLSIVQALDIARQITEALEAAHEKRIIHRDLKPANIKITSSGHVKVLDFGLAKAAAGDAAGPDLTQSPTLTIPGTGEGVILGTAAYMSPEQARGQPVDTRTDIWSFGCVLYEMLAGRPTFAGETSSDTIAAVLEREPNWRALPKGTPDAIRRLLERCLEKDSKRRLRDVGNARIDIDDALSLSSRPQSRAATKKTRALRLWQTLAIVSLVALAIVGGTLILRSVPRARSATPAMGTTGMTGARLTSYGGRQYAAALAPDGRSFVFVSNHAGSPDIWLRQVSGGEPVRLTNDAAEEGELAFAPDGEGIYFTRVDADREAIWQIGALGGQARTVIINGHSAAPSPDGQTLAYMTAQPGDVTEALVLGGLKDGAKRSIADGVPAFPRGRPAWSPDGHFVSYIRSGLNAPGNLFIVDVSTGRERQVTRFTRANEGVGQHVWLPDGRHLVVSYQPYSRSQVPSDLGILDVNDGSITRLTTTISDNFLAPSVSTDGSRLIATAAGRLLEVWKVPLASADPDANGRAAVRLIDGGQDPQWIFVARDSRTLLFNSPISGSRNVWAMQLDGRSKPRQITSLSGDAISHSSLSPDGQQVAFVSLANGASDIWTQNLDGPDLRPLTNDLAADSWPVWSPDGRSIVFGTVRDRVQQTWLAPSQGGPGEKLIDGFFRGDWVDQPGGAGTWIVTSNNADGIRLIDVEKRALLWDERIAGAAPSLPMFSPDRRSISVVIQENRNRLLEIGNRAPSGDAVTILDVATRKQRIAARLPFHIVFRASWVDNGTALIVNRIDTTSHIVMLDRFWPIERR